MVVFFSFRGKSFFTGYTFSSVLLIDGRPDFGLEKPLKLCVFPIPCSPEVLPTFLKFLWHFYPL